MTDTPNAATPDVESPRALTLKFTGSGSEYFRIWAVNMLLILVTLGLYLPFAKARRIRYFYANTLVDGQALSFHGDPRKMFRGFLLLVLLMAAYGAADHFSPFAGVLAFGLLCALWPALWRASLQFRLGNTAWRGLRMRFEGATKDAYLACLPVYLPAIAFVAVSTLLLGPEAQQAPSDEFPAEMGWGLGFMGLMTLLGPWSMALFKRYQHKGYRIAGQHARIDLPTSRVYVLSLKTLGVTLLAILLGIALLAVGGLIVAVGGISNPKSHSVIMSLSVVAGLMIYLLMLVVGMPYSAARMQNLAWNGTRSEALSFVSRLRFRDLLKLTLKNWLLTALTLGLYRPFAAVATARLRLEAVSIDCADDPATWLAAATSGHADATGEVAGDFFGLDMGL